MISSHKHTAVTEHAWFLTFTDSFRGDEETQRERETSAGAGGATPRGGLVAA